MDHTIQLDDQVLYHYKSYTSKLRLVFLSTQGRSRNYIKGTDTMRHISRSNILCQRRIPTILSNCNFGAECSHCNKRMINKINKKED